MASYQWGSKKRIREKLRRNVKADNKRRRTRLARRGQRQQLRKGIE